jgi:di/tricarboxylate transporter
MDYSAAYSVLGLFLLTIVFLIKYQTRPHSVFGVLLLVLLAGGYVTSSQVVNSFANEGVLTLILLMICSLALEKTSFLRRLSHYIIRSSYWSSWLRLIAVSASASSLLNNSAVVATLLAPVRNNPHHPASKLLIPLSYAAILGGTLTLVGTSTNLIVNSMVIDAGFAPLGFF